MPPNITIKLGDTIEWAPEDKPLMLHTITSSNIPDGAIPFDYVWQMPMDLSFSIQYTPKVTGVYEYECTPHINFGMVGQFTVTE